MLEPAIESYERSSLRLAWSALTDVGKVRKLNEDSFVAQPGMYVVADGMGGHAAGDVASKLAVEVCKEAATHLPLGLQDVEQLVALANRRVRQHAAAAGTDGMGTTLVGLVLFDNGGDDGLVVVNVGDSRCYSWDDINGLVRLTRDHSVVQELVDAGTIAESEASRHPERNVVTRAIGIEAAVAADFFVLPQMPRRRLLLCSDGVSGQIDDEFVGDCLAGGGVADAVTALIAGVLNGPASDNATAIVIDIEWDDVRPSLDATSDDDVTGPRPEPTGPSTSGLIDSVPIGLPNPGTRSGASHVPICEVPV